MDPTIPKNLLIKSSVTFLPGFCHSISNYLKVCSLLLSHGADPTLLNCHSKSAIDVAPNRELQVDSNHFFFHQPSSIFLSGEAWGWIQRTLFAGQLQARRSTETQEVPNCWGGWLWLRSTNYFAFKCVILLSAFTVPPPTGYKLQAALHRGLGFALCCQLAPSSTLLTIQC